MRKVHGTLLFRVTVAAWVFALAGQVAVGQVGVPGQTCSSPIALEPPHEHRLWVVNPENNSVSLMEVAGNSNVKIGEIPVGMEPQSIAITPNGRKVYVTNAISGSVTVINAMNRHVVKVVPVGTEPHGCALTPDGKKLYVANFNSDSVSVIDTATDLVVTTIPNVGPKPRAIAITPSGKVYVTLFLAQLRDDARPIDQKEGRDDGKVGKVVVISSATDLVLSSLDLNPLATVGFNSNGSVLDGIPATDPATFTFATGAFPNLLQGICCRGDRAYLPNVGASPNGPVRFNVNVQGFLSVFNTSTDLDSGQTINMNSGVQFEPVGIKLFNTTPIAIAFKRRAGANEGYVALGSTDRLIRVVVDAMGTPTVNAPLAAGDPGGIIRIPVGKNPRGVVINSTDTRAYVMNFISRDVSVVDLTKNLEIARIPSASLPTPGTLAAAVHRGQELFNTSIGPAGTNANALPPAGRMSDFGWGSCYNCHPNGLHDGVTWMFGDGPRQTISMESTAEHPQPPTAMLNANFAPLLPSSRQRVLNWSAVRDEIQDFELNIRGVSGGQGLIRDGLAVFNLTPTANTGRDPDLDNIATYISFGIRAPISPLRGVSDPDIAAGRSLFSAANCQSCHGGPNWTSSRVNFTPPPSAAGIVDTQLVAFLNTVGTFDPLAANELRPNIVTARGALGINNPSLLSVHAGAPYLHSGASPTLDHVLLNVTHRSAGTSGVDTLANAADRAKVIKFLKSIDATTLTFP